MEKLVFFGGTGMTGMCAVKHALDKGYHVRCLIRSENTVPDFFKDKVELVKGDVTNPDDVKAAVEGMAAVVVTLGTRNKLDATTMMSTGLQNIVDAMKEHGLKKISVCLSSFLFMDVEKVPKVFHELNADHQRMLNILKASGLEYRAVHPPHIADEPSGEFIVTYDKSPGPRTISKWDLGKFLVDSLFQDEHSAKVIGIATVKKDA